VWVELAGTARRILELDPASFVPRPRVSASVVCIDVDPHSPLKSIDTRALERLLRAGFGQRRFRRKST
jgi:16S rRNA A1518/A1519 N6-dimethyltransferase RsmA/KsgA/DIM1 with predicted DNA glycosylase/AP lyase activity